MEILEFSWLPALAGGIMIGTASALLMAFMDALQASQASLEGFFQDGARINGGG